MKYSVNKISVGSENPVRVLNLGTVSYRESQSIYHAIAECMTIEAPDTIVLCVPREPYFCIGYHQSSLQVLKFGAPGKTHYPVMRRKLGGGLTYLDDQQVFYQCIFHKSRSPVVPAQVYRSRLCSPIRVLNRIGLPSELLYTNEIEVNGRRIAGIGGGQIGEASVVVGNILNDFDFHTMASVINAPCEEFHQVTLSAMQRRITTLKREGKSKHWSQLPTLLIEEYQSSLNRPIYYGKLSSQERISSKKWAKRMTSRSFLEQQEKFVSSNSQPMINLKISGSTSVFLLRYKMNAKSKYVIVEVCQGKIERIKKVENRMFVQSESKLRTKVPLVRFSDIQLGCNLSTI